MFGRLLSRRGTHPAGRSVRGWPLWSTSPPVLAYVLVVDALALALSMGALRMVPITGGDWARLGLLTGCALVHIDVSRTIERHREVSSGGGPYLDPLSVWEFASVLILPPALAVSMVLVIRAFAYVRIWRRVRVPLYRWVFSTAAIVLGMYAAAVVLAAGPGAYPGVPAGMTGLAIMILAAVLFWAINYGLVTGAILISTPTMTAAELIAKFDEQIIEVGAIGLGMATAVIVVHQPTVLVGVVVGLLALHRSVLIGQFQRAARTDGKTGLLTAIYWHELAQHELDRARQRGTTLGVLMIDLDHFKQVNDTHGHPAGDAVLAAVADAVTAQIRALDTAARFGGEELIVALPGATANALFAVSERIRHHIEGLTVDVPGLTGQPTAVHVTASIGGALYPDAGTTLDQLLIAADAALYDAKHAGRNRTHITAPRQRSPRANTDRHSTTD